MTPHFTSLAVMVPVMVLVVWRRVRRQFGLQPIRRGRMLARVVAFAALGALMVIFSLARPPLLEGLLGGAVAGVLLGVVGLRLTRFERQADGSDGYVPHPWIGALLTALLLGRLAWRLLVVMPSMPVSVSSAAPAFGYSPLTLALFGLLVGYYVAYGSGLLVHHRRFERAQAAPAPGALSAGD
ncbi:MAG TPA: CcdC protein domain-containing protein [Dyella sp.]|nr:CcdC protein domain-containing protein [Dyella sp.]